MTDPHDPDSQEAYRARQRGRNIALGLTLGALALLFYLITIVRIPVGF